MKIDSSAQEKTLEQSMTFDKRPWLQLICYALVSSCEVGCLFQNEGKSTE